MDQVDLVLVWVVQAAKMDIHNNKDKETCSSLSLDKGLTPISTSPFVALEIPSQKLSVISWSEKVKTLYNLNFTIKLIKIKLCKILLVNHSVSPREERHSKPCF
jgi:hypothetical protein